MAMIPHGPADPNVLVGSDTLDDAAVYRLTDEIALVLTVDFFTPVVDDPYDFGRIAAANALSDIYAMGASPLTALNVVCFPASRLPLEFLGEILRGGAAVADQAGVTIVGGHTVDDQEPKYGLAVTGTVVPGRQMTNASGRPGDALILTKPLGTGAIATAIKQGVADPASVFAATESMATLNKEASWVARDHGLTAVTDVTGFGLLGHLSELCEASGVSAEVWYEKMPLLPGVAGLAQAGVVPGGTRRNLDHVSAWTLFDPALEPWQRLIAADAQTSGGLLLCVPEAEVSTVLADLSSRGVSRAAQVGRLLPRSERLVEVRLR